jgi:hypothetical protein
MMVCLFCAWLQQALFQNRLYIQLQHLLLPEGEAGHGLCSTSHALLPLDETNETMLTVAYWTQPTVH